MEDEIEEDELEQELEETRKQVKNMIEKMQASTEKTESSDTPESFTDPETGLEFDTREGLELFQKVREKKQ